MIAFFVHTFSFKVQLLSVFTNIFGYTPASFTNCCSKLENKIGVWFFNYEIWITGIKYIENSSSKKSSSIYLFISRMLFIFSKCCTKVFNNPFNNFKVCIGYNHSQGIIILKSIFAICALKFDAYMSFSVKYSGKISKCFVGPHSYLHDMYGLLNSAFHKYIITYTLNEVSEKNHGDVVCGTLISNRKMERQAEKICPPIYAI